MKKACATSWGGWGWEWNSWSMYSEYRISILCILHRFKMSPCDFSLLLIHITALKAPHPHFTPKFTSNLEISEENGFSFYWLGDSPSRNDFAHSVLETPTCLWLLQLCPSWRSSSPRQSSSVFFLGDLAGVKVSCL